MFNGRLAGLTLWLTCVAAVSSAANIKLNDPLSPPQAVVAYSVSPDSHTVVYVVGDNDTLHATMYSIPAIRTSSPVQLNGTVVGNAIGPITLSTFLTPKISPDSQWVVYPSDEANENEIELYTVPINGSAAPTLLTGVLGPEDDVQCLDFTPDGNSVVFIAGNSATGVYNLYQAPVDASSAAIDLTAATTRRPALLYRFTPDGSTIVFQGIDMNDSSIVDVFTVPVGGGTLNQISNLGRAFAIYPLQSNDRAFFIADPTTNRYNLYTVPVNGSSAPVQVNPALPTISADAYMSRHFPDEGIVVFRMSDFNVSNPESLWVANEDGTGATRLHPDTYDFGTIDAYTKDHTRCLAIGRPIGYTYVYPYWLNLDGSTVSPTMITTPFSTVGTVYTGNTNDYFWFRGSGPGFSQEFVRYDPETDTLVRPLEGKGVTYSTYPGPVFSADDTAFTFGVYESGGTQIYLYSFGTDRVEKMTGTYVSGGDLDTDGLNPISFAENDTAVIYRAEQDIDMVAELYVSTDLVLVLSARDEIWTMYE